jgi:hypothetical protein
MYESNTAGKIWDRACFGGGEAPRSGDKALTALLLFHGLAMNGGVIHALECLALEQISAAKYGYRYFGFEVISELINAAQEVIENKLDRDMHDTKMSKEYWGIIPNDDVLIESFERHQQQHPLEYSPIID